MKTRIVVFDTDSQLNVSEYPTIELYQTSDEDAIDMALLKDMVSPTKLVFLGFDNARRLSTKYGGVWLVNEYELMQTLNLI